jgi:hypothetical protein
MDKKYATTAAKLVAYGLNWISKEELTKSLKRPMRNVKIGKLSKNQIVEIVGRDCAGGANGLPVMHGARIANKPKRK